MGNVPGGLLEYAFVSWGNEKWKADAGQRGRACLTSLGPKAPGSSQPRCLILTSGPLHMRTGQRDGSHSGGHDRECASGRGLRSRCFGSQKLSSFFFLIVFILKKSVQRHP